VLVVSYGSSARAASRAVQQAREAGLRVGQLRVVTVWPFPEERLKAFRGHVDKVLVPEMNMGQLRLEVERVMGDSAEVVGIHRADGELFQPEQIYREIREVL